MQDEMKFIGGVNFKELQAQRVKVYDTLTLDLTAARANVKLTWTGNYLYVLEATDIGTTLQVRLNEIPRSLITLYKGRGVRAPFYRLWLTNAAQPGKSITLAVGVEADTFEVFDLGKALEITGMGGSAGVPAYAQVSVTAAATLIKAANGNRRSILVQNLDPANTLYIGYDNAVTTANAGHALPPNCAVELTATTTIYGIRAAGAGNAGYLEETNA